MAAENMKRRGNISSEGHLIILDKLLEGTDEKVSCSDQKSRDYFERKMEPFYMMRLENGMFSVCLDTKSYIFFDSEADIFCVSSKNSEGLTEFIMKLKELCKDENADKKTFIL